MPEITEIESPVQFSATEIKRADSLAKKVAATLSAIHEGRSQFIHGFAELGTLLLPIQKNQFWRLWGFASFNSYITSLGEKINQGRTQIYNALSVASALLPHLSEKELTDMGISKAIELKRVVTQANRAPSKEIIARATNPDVTLQELRAEIFEQYHVRSENGQKGKYWDIGGCYLTTDERAEVERAFELAARTEPAIEKNVPDHIRLKEIMLRLCQEYLATYEKAMEAAS